MPKFGLETLVDVEADDEEKRIRDLAEDMRPGRALRIREVILYLSKKEGRPTTFKKAVGLRLIHDLLWLNQELPWYHFHHCAGQQQ